jgi:hypothetical protein
MSRLNLSVNAQLRNPFSAVTMGAASTRPSLCPLTFERVEMMQSSGEFRREDADSCLSTRHCERSEAIQKCIRGDSLDCFASLAMTECAIGKLNRKFPLIVPDRRVAALWAQIPSAASASATSADDFTCTA